MVRPLNMTAEELTLACAAAREKFYGFRSVIGRLVDGKANGKNIDNICTFILANIVAGLDIKNKTGMRLGIESDNDMLF